MTNISSSADGSTYSYVGSAMVTNSSEPAKMDVYYSPSTDITHTHRQTQTDTYSNPNAQMLFIVYQNCSETISMVRLHFK